MLFNSINFAVFLPIVFSLYWSVENNNVKYQNILLLAASYYFYACWDWKFLFLLIFSTTLDYYTGIKIFEVEKKNLRRFWFWLSVLINLGLLGVFKYYNFFAASFAGTISNMGFQVNPWTLKVILPVAISFYTFHGLSYIIDIYKGRIKPEISFINYSLFVSFFPLLVAGPIERATHLLPQIQNKRTFDYSRAVDGLRQILWGLFKKVVVADYCSEYANLVFNNSHAFGGSTLALGAVFFTFQIYCDFSGYSDIALGTARLFGIDLLKNFAFPYFSRDIAEFWRRWHISLSSWFKDYIYIPMGGSKGGIWQKVRNTFIIFLMSGFWHGANWTFLAWGFLNALYIMPSIILKSNRKDIEVVAKGKIFPSIKELVLMISTFSLTVLAWIVFRAANISHALYYISRMFSRSLISVPYFPGLFKAIPIVCLIIIEWLGRENNYAIEKMAFGFSKYVRISFYFILIAAIFLFSGEEQPFIYFQF